MGAELFSSLEHALDYDGNPESELIALIGGEKHLQEETPALIGLFNGKYIMAFKPGESKGVLLSNVCWLEY